MRPSDQADGTSSTLNGPMNSYSSAVSRRFAGTKISVVRFLSDNSEFTERFVSGSCDSVGRGVLTLWKAHGQSNKASDDSNIERSYRLFLDGANVNYICVINAQQFVVSTTSGDIRIVDCPTNPDEEGRLMKAVANFAQVHKHSASNALCVLNNEIYSGSESGQIVRVQPASRSSQAVRPFAEDLMGVCCLTPCGPNEFVSSHTTGQIHLWDVRKRTINNSEFGLQPLLSRPVTALNHAVTALATHPAQHNIIAFGTQDGVVSFIDIRQTNQTLPVAFKVSQEPINQLNFHPIFANNCFSVSDSSLIHWDASALAREVNPQLPLRNGGNSELMAAMMDVDEDGTGEHRNVWLSARASTSVNLRVILEEPRLLNSFDIVQGALVAGSRTAEVVYLSGYNFSN